MLSYDIRLTEVDGGGFQALSTLSILSKLCDAIASDKGTDRKLAPHELFDIIGGIGTGGWLALLLGRYRLDLTRCMTIYLELAGDPQITAERSFFGSRPYILDQKRLIARIDHILERFELSPWLLDDEVQNLEEDVKSRCKHAFAVGAIQYPKEEGPKYDIFRSYRCAKTSGPFYHPGPDPGTCKVSSVCAATGATKYLLQPHSIGSTTYSDNGFPNPHNITDLALDEAYHIYGEKPPLSVVVNIGPGIPSEHDVKKLQRLARKFSWPYWLPSVNRARPSLKSSPSTSPTSSITSTSDPISMESPNRSDSSSSSSSEAEQAERQIEANIERRLDNDYRTQKMYTRLAPTAAGDDLALNDVQVILASSKDVDQYFESDVTKERVREVARSYDAVVIS